MNPEISRLVRRACDISMEVYAPLPVRFGVTAGDAAWGMKAFCNALPIQQQAKYSDVAEGAVAGRARAQVKDGHVVPRGWRSKA